MDSYRWYSHLKKPLWAPPSWLFGPVWTMLYILIALSFGKVFLMVIGNKAPLFILTPFLLNIMSNALFTPLQFGLRNNALAALDIFVILISLIWLIVVIYPLVPWVAYLQIPYLLWVSFATILQLSITYLNQKK